MKQEFIPYEQALELKELGMDLGWDSYIEFYDTSTKDFCDIMKEVPAPLYQQAFRWFREKYDLYISIVHYENGYSINDLRRFDTYEEAELACLNKLIEIVGTIELPKHPSVISENGNELLFDKEGNLIKELPKQETLYTEEQVREAYWIGVNRGNGVDVISIDNFLQSLKQSKND